MGYCVSIAERFDAMSAELSNMLRPGINIVYLDYEDIDVP